MCTISLDRRLTDGETYESALEEVRNLPFVKKYKAEVSIESVLTAKFGTLGLFKSTMVPKIEVIIVEKSNSELAYGSKGVGEITCISTALAAQGAYYKLYGIFRTKLHLKNTFYKK